MISTSLFYPVLAIMVWVVLANFLLPSPMHLDFFSFSFFKYLSRVLGSLLGKAGLLCSLSCPWVLVSLLFEFSLTDLERGCNRFVSFCQFHSLYCALSANYSMHSWAPPDSLGVWCWIPRLPWRYFCSWVDAKLVKIREDKKEYLTPPWCDFSS